MSGNRFLEKAPLRLIDQLRAFFHPKDRSVILADETFVEGENMTPGNPVVGRGRLFWRDKCWRQLDEDGNEEALCPGDWQSWTPTITQGVSVSFNTDYARYVTEGETAIVWALLNVTSAGTAGQAIAIGNQPAAIQPANTDNNATIGSGIVFNTGTARYDSVLVAPGVQNWRFFHGGNNNFVGAAPNFALANGDEISFVAIFERA